ncbi:tRNA (uridine(54)-C5)-methyltransferase TrmA [Marinospirillum alkaliphilum]|uniref:tRNA/tmRNA (uracil-C(5))-methyltransferase n=1 Tax=Marinospirillum alkaliphilum DSM 21637 TaxID=1122209 RepID=A0A1K1YGK9_9GAMM|nr:tRNA (uridine(54)-C5)-methyltransferase TrmA [Marinospirillum alkaliphilum]SFX60910.1 tRNA (uracil-5-)-methyltransferase [Marinospirillum alkaliphilum DSM 21637]
MSSTLPQVNPALYDQQLANKAERLRQQFAQFQPPELEVFASPPSHYRLRTEFRIWHEGEDLFYVMFEVGEDPKKDRTLVRMDQYPVAGTAINRLMPLLLDSIRDQPLLRRKLFQVEFLTTLSNQVLITLIYHRPLDDAWETAARELQQQLGVMLIGRSRGQKRVLQQDFVLETLQVNGRSLTYKQVEGSFTQPNPWMGQKMLEWALDASRPTTDETPRDLVELYCGNGNFTLALAPNFRRVLGTEISRTSVAAAQYNITANNISNVRIERMAAEDFSVALDNPTSAEAIKFELQDYDFSTVLVDPPRAGLDAATLAQVQRFERILYISCNPDTLADNLNTLTRTHRVERFAFFDQFPYTHHAECGVYLVKEA